jgi:uroporphyrinogen III methyltransferase/synthase
MVSLVGAGPGHPQLLTLWAVECLRRADLVLYDRLVSPALLEHAPPEARQVCVTELPGAHPERGPQVQEMMIDAARRGLRVVRLKGGDPFVFGRGGEEAEALRAAGVAYEIVPGVTAALGAAACAAIPLTHRLHASAVAFVAAHEQPDKPDSRLDWKALAAFPGTLVFYMPVGHLAHLVENLLAHGKPAYTRAAAVKWAATNRQHTAEAPLAGLPEAVRQAGLAAPAVVLVGDVVTLRPRLAWFESRPLFGKRVLITRPRHQAGALAHRLEDLGAITSVLSVVEVREPADYAAIDDALARLDRFQWLVFTSANGVHALVQRLRQTGRDLRALGRLRFAVIGPATADALRTYHLNPDLVPAEYNSEGLADALRETARGGRVLLARADRGVDVLRQRLAEVAEVEQVAVYSQVDAAVPQGHEALAALRAGEMDYVTLTSSNIARALAAALDADTRELVRAGRVGLVTISPRTSAVMRELGLPVAAQAREYTSDGVAAALCELARGGRCG